MKVWKVHYLDSGETDLYEENTDIFSIPSISIELSYIEGGYEDERNQFVDDIGRARCRGRGSAEIKERLHVELTEAL